MIKVILKKKNENLYKISVKLEVDEIKISEIKPVIITQNRHLQLTFFSANFV